MDDRSTKLYVIRHNQGTLRPPSVLCLVSCRSFYGPHRSRPKRRSTRVYESRTRNVGFNTRKCSTNVKVTSEKAWTFRTSLFMSFRPKGGSRHSYPRHTYQLLYKTTANRPTPSLQRLTQFRRLLL